MKRLIIPLLLVTVVGCTKGYQTNTRVNLWPQEPQKSYVITVRGPYAGLFMCQGGVLYKSDTNKKELDEMGETIRCFGSRLFTDEQYKEYQREFYNQ